jgi:hypothetical protein
VPNITLGQKKDAVTISETPPPGGVPRSAHAGRWSIMLMVAILLWSALSVLLVAMITANVPVTNNYVTSGERDSSTSVNNRMGSVEEHINAPPLAQGPTQLVFVNNPMKFSSEPPPSPCGGDKPGICPGFSATPAQSEISTVSAGFPMQTSSSLLTPPLPAPGMSSPPG